METSRKKATLVANFTMEDDLRFLSHQETLRMLRRALIRANIDLWYSQGFNPHPKITLPLPRSVGVASKCEMMNVLIYVDDQPLNSNEIEQKIQDQLPAGCMISEMRILEGAVTFQPEAVEYFIPVDVESPGLHSIIGRVTAVSDAIKSDLPLMIERVNHKKNTTSEVQVNEFIAAVKIADKGVLIKCLIKPNGTIRLEEIIELLGCSDKLAGAIERRSVQWALNN